MMPFTLRFRRKDGTIVKRSISITEAFRTYTPKKKSSGAKVAPEKLEGEKAAVKAAEQKSAGKTDKPTFTEAETTQLRELKAETPVKSWKQIAEIMTRDVDELKAYYKEIKNGPAAASVTAGNPGHDIKDDKSNGSKSSNHNEGGRGKKGNGDKELTEEQRQVNEAKKTAGLARQAESKAKNGSGASGSTIQMVLLDPTNGQASVNGTTDRAEAMVKALASKVGKENIIAIQSRYFDKTGRRLTDIELQQILS